MSNLLGFHGVRIVEKEDSRNYIKTIETSSCGFIAIDDDADNAVFPLDTPVMLAGFDSKTLAACGDDGTLKPTLEAIADQGYAPLTVVVRVAKDSDPEAQATLIIAGIEKLALAQNAFDFKPRLLAVPGLENNKDVIDALVLMADRLKSFAYAACAASDEDEAKTWRDQFDHKRLLLIYPELVKDGNPIYAAASALGKRAAIDNDHPQRWAKSLSNVPLKNITGMTHPVDFDWTDESNAANTLNKNHITTVIKHNGQYRFWGNRTTSTETNWMYETSVRTADMIDEVIMAAQFERIDEPLTQVLIEDIVEDAANRLDLMKQNGLIVDARVWMDASDNTLETIMSGGVWINYEFTPIKPLEQLGFNSSITNKFLLGVLPEWITQNTGSTVAA